MSSPSLRAEILCSQIMLSASRFIQAIGADDEEGAASQLFEMRFAQDLLLQDLAETRPRVISGIARRINEPEVPSALPVANVCTQTSLFQETTSVL